MVNEHEDEFDVVGRNIANKLKKLAPEVAAITEKLIMDVIFEAQLGNIDRYSRVTISTTVQHNQALRSTYSTLQPLENRPLQPHQEASFISTGSFLSQFNPTDISEM